MSRRSKSSRSTTPIRNSPAVHPDTLSFLKRSLRRNDVELAAIDKLNEALRKLRDDISNDPRGERILLQLGTGEICIKKPFVTIVVQKNGNSSNVNNNNDEGSSSSSTTTKLQQPLPSPDDVFPPQLEDNPVTANLSPTMRKLCLDFIERRTLRRKLLNRLFRRLLRVSATMDTTDSTSSATVEDPSKPPPAPRYGEDRLTISPQAAKDCWERVQKQQEALEHVLLGENGKTTSDTSSTEADKQAAAKAFLEYKEMYTRLVEQQKGKKGGGNEDEAVVHYLAETEDKPAIWNGPKIGASQRSMTAKEKEAEFQRYKAALLARIPLQPTFAEVAPSVFDYEQRLAAIQQAELEEKENGESGKEDNTDSLKESEDLSDTNHDEDNKDDKDKMQEKDEAPESTGKDEEAPHTQEDNMEIEEMPKNETEAEAMELDNNEKGSGSNKDDTDAHDKKRVEEEGSSQKNKHNSMEVDKTEDLGNVNGENSATEKAGKESISTKEETASVAEKKYNIDEETKDDNSSEAKPTKEDTNEDEERSDLDVDQDEDESKQKKGEEEAEENEGEKEKDEDDEGNGRKERNKIVRPISLIPVPSFYEQDMKRIKLVHAELMSSSMQDFARRRTQEVVAEYNKGMVDQKDHAFKRFSTLTQLFLISSST